MTFEEKDINLIPAIERGYKPDFLDGKNIIGSSQEPFGLRSTVISKQEGLELEWKNELLAGNIWHYGMEKPEVGYEITKEINKALGYHEVEVRGIRFIELDNGNYMLFEALNEHQFAKKYPQHIYYRIMDGFYLRRNPDYWTTLYCIEYKTSTMPKVMWKEIAPYQIKQLNTNIALSQHAFGFLIRCDLGSTREDTRQGGFFTSKSKRMSYVWNKFYILYKHNYNHELFISTLKRSKEYAICIRDNIEYDKIPCPHFVFECSDSCKEYCRNPIVKVKVDVNETCAHCKQEIRAGTQLLIRNNQSYHYTDADGNEMKKCVQACIKAWEVKSND